MAERPPVLTPPAMADLTELTAAAACELLRSRAIGALELVESHVARIEAVDPALNAVVVRRFDEALAEARAADARLARRRPAGILQGLPITIKESLDLAGTASTAGVRRWSERKAHLDAPVVTALRRAGAIVLGKT